MKKYIKKIIFVFCLVCCFAFAVAAQDNKSGERGERKPPVIVPNEERKPKDKRRDEKRDKKKAKDYAVIAGASAGIRT